MSQCVLIVDDDPVQRRILEQLVTKFGYIARLAEGGEQALATLDGPGGEEVRLIILDLVMPDLDGMGVLERLRQKDSKIPAIVQTANGGIDTVVSAMRAGAVDFVVKPVSPERLEVSIRNALKVDALEGQLKRARRKISGTFSFSDIVTRSPAMNQAVTLGQRAATSNIPIIIEGESGVGKELFARAIQGSSSRQSKPLVTVNCGAIPENLVESILFGHEKGSFTGATDKHVGKFVEADGGTLFLDEVSELPLDAQVKLLRAVQEGEVDPVGGKKSIKVNIRLISATNRNMMEQVRRGNFREDLYYRLNVFPITVPPVRERLEDVPLLVNHFITQFAAEEGKRVNGADPQVMAMLQRYRWPGNVRQIENAVFRAVVLANGPMLTMDEFPQIALQVAADEGVTELPKPDQSLSSIVADTASVPIGADGQSQANDAENMPCAQNYPVQAFSSPPPASEQPGTLAALDDGGEIRPLEAIEADIIR
ncbi:MAG: sigma-54 dependent transcriptional regulator, partial [Fimbriimonadaceae bacterium]|nr:sigma-54 dependent transcriptional regulator [Alphaproteobacteria bacterium]